MAFPTPTAPTVTQFPLSVSSMTVNMPATVNAGERLAVWVEVRNGGTWNTIPSGWEQKGQQTGGAGVGQLTVFEKFADGSEGGTTETWVHSIATSGVWQAIAVANAHASTELEVLFSSGDASAANPPSLTPSWGAEDTLWLAIAGHAAATTAAWSAAPTNYTGFQSNGASSGGAAVSLAFSYRQLNASTEDPGAFTVSGSNRFWAAMTIAIRPGGGAPPVVETQKVNLMTLMGVG